MKGTYRKDELLAIIRRNRDTHAEVLAAALEGYKVKALEILEGNIQQIKQGKIPELRILLGRPQNHAGDYDRIIKMLEMEVADEVPLDEGQFAHYVMDQWDWKARWVRSMSDYAAGATERAYGAVEDDA